VLFGHSVGTLMAYELARWLQCNGDLTLRRLIVSGRSAPHVRSRREPMHELSDRDLVEKLRRYNGTPSVVLETPELLEFFLPRLRADFEMNETYRAPQSAPALQCPVNVFSGESDPETTEASVLAWQEHTCGAFEHRSFPGGHFFIHDPETAVLESIQAIALRDFPH
jgi:medium-chain acyl-[acyl-carrier-protein] hydrolase